MALYLNNLNSKYTTLNSKTVKTDIIDNGEQLVSTGEAITFKSSGSGSMYRCYVFALDHLYTVQVYNTSSDCKAICLNLTTGSPASVEAKWVSGSYRVKITPSRFKVLKFSGAGTYTVGAY